MRTSVFLLLIFLVPLSGWTEEKTGANKWGEEWRRRLYGAANGLNSDTVTAVFQRSDNRIFVATDVGVCRFDLWRWDVLTTPDDWVVSDPVSQFVEVDGDLFAVTEKSLWSLQGDGLERQRTTSGRFHVARAILDRRRTGAGRFPSIVYVVDTGTRQHLELRSQGREERAELGPLELGEIYDYEIDTDQNHWLAMSDGLYRRDSERAARWRRAERFEMDPDLDDLECRSLHQVVEALLPRRTTTDGPGHSPIKVELWGYFVQPDARELGGRLARFIDGKWQPVAHPEPFKPVTGILLDSDGVYYVTTTDGLLHVSSDLTAWREVSEVGFVLLGGLIDNAGDFWFRRGAGRGVVTFDLRSRRWERILIDLSRGRLLSALSLVEVPNRRELWVGLEDGVARYGPEEEDRQFWYDEQDTPLQRVTGLAVDERNDVFVSSAEFKGVLRWQSDEDGNGSWTRIDEGLGDYHFVRIVRDSSNDLWFLPHARAGRRVGSIFRRWKAEPEFAEVELPDDIGEVRDLARTGADYWLATNVGVVTGELVPVLARRFRFVIANRFGDKLPSTNTWRLAAGPDGDIWVGYDYTGSPVTRIEPDLVVGPNVSPVTNFDEIDGQLWSLTAMGGDMWFGTSNGFTRFDGDCFYRFSLPGSEADATLVWPILSSRLESGTLLIGTSERGVWRFRQDDTRLSRMYLRVPEVAEADGSLTITWEAHDHRTKTPDDQLQFRTRLQPDSWTPFSTKRSVTYTRQNLPVGDHTFEAEVRDLDGRSFRPPPRTITISPQAAASSPWWSVPVLLTALGGCVALVFLFSRLRGRRRRLLRYRGVFYTSPSPLFILDSDGCVSEYNGCEPELLGLEREMVETVMGRPLHVLPALSGNEISEKLKRLGNGDAFLHHFHRWQRADDGEKVYEVTGFPLFNAAGRPDGAVVSLHDRTTPTEERSRRERERRLASLRELAREVNTSLQALVVDTRALTNDSDDPEQRARFTRAVELLESLGAFAGDDGVEAVDEVLINELVQRSVDAQIKRQRSAHVTVDFRGQTGLWPVRGVESLLAAAVDAIVENAAEAMPESGTLAIRTANVRLEGDAGPLRDGGYVELSISDTGSGMDPAHAEKALEPFFTTKSRAQSHGTGLSRAFGAVRAHGGDLRVRSVSGSGTVVTIYLPASR